MLLVDDHELGVEHVRLEEKDLRPGLAQRAEVPAAGEVQ